MGLLQNKSNSPYRYKKANIFTDLGTVEIAR